MLENYLEEADERLFLESLPPVFLQERRNVDDLLGDGGGLLDPLLELEAEVFEGPVEHLEPGVEQLQLPNLPIVDQVLEREVQVARVRHLRLQKLDSLGQPGEDAENLALR